MSPAAQTLVKKLIVLATLAGLGSAVAFLLVACGGGRTSVKPRAAVWQALPAAPISAPGLTGVASAWTGKELIVVGVRPGPDGTFIKSTNVAAAYDPSTHTWRRLARAPKMQDYCSRDVAWTGKELLLWGCGQAALDPQTSSWRTLPKAPTGEGLVAWTGRELIGWGGGCCGDAWGGGSAYNPAANAWRTLARSPLAPSQSPLGAWTGRELVLVVNGYTPEDKPYSARLARAAAYDPATDTWQRLASPPPAALRYGGTAAWDGRELLVIGNRSAGSHAALAYNPATNSWRRLARPPAGLTPSEAFWTGRSLLVLGGDESIRGFAYDPKADRWTSLPSAPLQGSGETVAWTGSQLIVWSNVNGAVFTPATG
jgi:N-acetylneuraminic acid mutarotase